MPLIFVYGTLKRGGSNHHYLRGQRFMAEARTQPHYTLHSLGAYPVIIANDTEGRSIRGELWEVDAPCLTRLDRLEGTHKGLYARVPIPLLPPHDKLSAEGYLYLHIVAGRPEIGDIWNG
jgi:gamma-glutamylcyclotransferase (GGCT)/AIG2-like uncharacterized protein YtfP